MKPREFTVSLDIFLVACVFTGALFFLTGSSSAAPKWPTPALDYWEEASAHLATLEATLTLAFGDDGDLDAALEDLHDADDALAELDPPPVMASTHTMLAYAVKVCSQAVSFSIDLKEDSSGMAFAIGPLTTMRYECARSIRDARVEAERYAATVGGFPPED